MTLNLRLTVPAVSAGIRSPIVIERKAEHGTASRVRLALGQRAEGHDRRAGATGAGRELPAPHLARQDRHPARGARGATAAVRGPQRPRPGRRRQAHGDPQRKGRAAHVSVVYCSECGFQNPEAANYCSRCGALLSKGEPSVETTQSFTPEEIGDTEHHDDLGIEGPALVVRAGGGRAGESFKPTGERTRIGRSPDCEIFL